MFSRDHGKMLIVFGIKEAFIEINEQKIKTD